MKMDKNEREFIEIYRKAKQDNDTDIIICIYAFVDMLHEQQGNPPSGLLTGFTRGEYKRAIKNIRAVQALVLRENQSGMVADCEQAVRYIRENCLNRMAVVA